jgi:hypothetical protein
MTPGATCGGGWIERRFGLELRRAGFLKPVIVYERTPLASSTSVTSPAFV